MTIINTNSISGINSITAQGSSGVAFYDSSGSSERLRIDSAGRLLKSGQAALTSTSLNHPIQVAAASDDGAIAIIGRAADDIGSIDYYEADKSTKLGEIQYRQDHANIRHRVGDIRFATGGVTERLRISSDGTVSLGIVDTASNATLHIRSPNSSENTRLELSTYDTFNGSKPDADIVFTQQNGTEIAKIQCDTATGAANMADLVFYTNFGGLGERLRIDKQGKLILPTGSPGIQFGSPDDPAASGGNDISSQTLDDYEEGTFTPEIFGLTISSSYGHYVKVGSLVTCVFYIDIGTKTYIGSGSGTTSLQILLPFNNNNPTNSYAGASIGNIRYIDFSSNSVKQFTMNIGGTNNRLTGRWVKHNSNFVDVLLGDLYNSFSIHASVTYQAA